MKKRNTPILLLTLLLLLGGTAAFMSASDRFGRPGDGHAHGEAPSGEPPSQGEARKSSASAEQLAEVASQASKPGGPSRPSRPGEGPESGRPLIAVDKPKPYKPMPNDSSIGTQWYTEEGAKDYKGKK